jgi:hypothetical protein
MRAQASRQKREAIDGAATVDARALNVAELAVLWGVDTRAGRVVTA